MSQTFILGSQFNRPTKMLRAISLSPLARLFQPGVSIEKYLDEPEAWKKETDPFKIIVQGSWATSEYEHGAVHLLDESLTFAFIGVDNSRFQRDYDYTGLVYFNVPEDITAALDYTMKTKRPLPEDIEDALKKHLEIYKELSHKRVLEHAKRLYNSLVEGRNKLKEAGKEPQAPNDMELLIAFILRDEVKKAKARRSKLQASFEQAAADIGGDINDLLG